MYLCKRSGNNHENSETSKSINVIIFPDGLKEKKGRCHGFKSEVCKYRITTQEIAEIVNNTNTGDLKDIVEGMKKDETKASSLNQDRPIPTINDSQAAEPATLATFQQLQKIVPLEDKRLSKKRPTNGPGGLTNGDVSDPIHPVN